MKLDYLENRLTSEDILTIFEDHIQYWSAHFGRLLLDNITLRPNLRVLDVGCGTGHPLFTLANMLGETGHCTGVDIWEDALELARRKQEAYRLPNLEIIQIDGDHLPFSEQEFDLIVSNVGVNNFENAPKVLKECVRVSKKLAKTAITTNTVGHMREFYAVFRDVLREVGNAEYVKRLNQQEAHRGTRESHIQLLEDAGYAISKVIEEQFTLRYLDGSAFLRYPLIRTGFLDGWRSVMEPQDEADIFTMLEERLNGIARERGELVMTIPMIYLEGEL